MSSHPSNSEPSPFDRLNEKVQHWIWDKGWNELRDIQAKAIGGVLDGENDVILAATTAAGKTEAAFLPILSSIALDNIDSFAILYVSPLKALINDQFRRLEDLCERLELPVVKWHGDASAAAKARAIQNPRGVVLITPESLESLLVRRGPDVRRLIHDLRFIVIDELHAFLSGERGIHLASLLKRLDATAGRRIRKVGLSATIGDFALAQYFMNPTEPQTVQLIESSLGQPELRLQVRGYREPDPDWETCKPEEERLVPAQTAIVAHLHQTLRGRNNLVFASRRQEVESVADALGRLSESKRVPNEFFPHHGSLSKTLREELEERLKSGELPTTAVATTTLELGIDIGSVTSVAQVGPPASVAGLRQRLGRSGRREGEPSVLRIYVREPDRPAEDDPFERLRLELVQAVAAVNILVSKWVEPGGIQGLHLSTLLHQTLALICERGGARAKDMFRLLCGPGPFAQVSEQDYAVLLRTMSDAKIIEQSPDGILMLGSLGETITNRFDFYAVFMTDDEYRIVTDQRTLGTVPIFNPLRQGDFLTFAGRRWIVLSIDDRAKVVMVKPAPAGRVPLFPAQEGIPLHDRLVQEMRGIYRSETSYPFLDLMGKTLLQEARDAYRDLGLDSRQLLNVGDDIYLFVWRGTKATETVRLALASQDIRTEAYSVGLHAKYCELEKFSGALHRILQYPPTAHDIAAFAEPLRRQKYDIYLPDPMLRDAFARTRVDLSVLEATNSLPSAV